jgi:hypothetical protein
MYSRDLLEVDNIGVFSNNCIMKMDKLYGLGYVKQQRLRTTSRLEERNLLLLVITN